MHPPRILVVDDEIIIARDLEARLGSLGYDVVGIASSGTEAIEQAGEHAGSLRADGHRAQGRHGWD